jgi:hypothetical protein
VVRLTWRDVAVTDTMVHVIGRLKGAVMFRKVLVANRGEIAIRAFRAGYELGARTVAVFPHEDRNSLHRLKADEAYEIGRQGHPVRAYLSLDEIVRAARQAGADAVYPGYGFLSENPAFVRACEENDLVFVGPDAEVMARMGDKAMAKKEMAAADVPLVPGTDGGATVADAREAALELGLDPGPSPVVMAVENTETVHHMVVCTLCSCYPRALLGPPPAWYKSLPYRSRAVSDPRGVLAQFGLEIGDDVQLRVLDSTADIRYLVIPSRPPGTDELSEEQLAALVTRDSMIGTGLPRSPSPHVPA